MYWIVQNIDLGTGKRFGKPVLIDNEVTLKNLIPIGSKFVRSNPWRQVSPLRCQFHEWRLGDTWYTTNGTSIKRVDVVEVIK